ncbi:MAG: CAP domain-containing protein [Actinomycetota bacterium]
MRRELLDVRQDLSAEDSEIVFDGHNAFRAAKGLTPLKFNVGISAISQGWSDYLGENTEFYHNPDFSTGAPGGFLSASENIAYRYDRSGKGLVQQWINSPGHNANMSHPAWGFIGIGVAYTDRNATYSTVNFFQYAPGAIPPGSYDHPRDYFSGKPQLTPTIPAMKTVKPAAPTWDTVKRTYTIPDSEEVEYRVGSIYSMLVAKKPGTHAADDGYHWIQAFGKEGYYVTPWSSSATPTIWDVTFPKFTAAAKAPVFDKAARTVTIPAVTGVQYVLNGVYEDAGVHRFLEAAVVKAKPIRGYELTGTTEWSVNVPLTKVTPKPPVFNQPAGTYTIPDVPGVQYVLNGTFIAPGTYKSRSPYVYISAQAKAEEGYAHFPHIEWQGDLSLIDVWPDEPDFNTRAGSYTIPATAGIQYAINGKETAAGTYAAGGIKITVTATAKAGYRNHGGTSWTQDFTPPKPPAQGPTKVTAAAPAFDRASGRFTIPRTTGVLYQVGGQTKTAGTYPGNGGNDTVIAKAAAGYTLTGTTSWTYDFAPVKVAAPAPTFNISRGSYTIPSKAGVAYYVDGARKTAETEYEAAKGKVTVTARAAAGYVLSGTASWSHDFTPPKAPAKPPVKTTAKAPVFDAKAGTYTIPSAPGVNYQANGKTVKAGVHSGGRSQITVTAKAAAGHTLAGTVSWKHDFRAKVTAAAPSFSRATGKYTIPARTGVSYAVNGKTVRAGTYKGNTAKVTITAKAAAGHALSGKTSWSYNFAPVKTTAAKPSFSTKSGKYTIPSRTGVSYLVNGKTVKAGAYKANHRVTTVTAKAKAGYALKGTTTWKHDFRRVVKAAAPSFSPKANGYTIPKKTGITYRVNGKTLKAGTYKVRNGQKVTVTAKASTTTYRLSGTAKWSSTL